MYLKDYLPVDGLLPSIGRFIKRRPRQEMIDEANRLKDSGLSLEEIAAAMKLSITSARKWVSRIPSWIKRGDK